MTRLVAAVAIIAGLWISGWLWPVVVGLLVLAAIVTADIRKGALVSADPRAALAEVAGELYARWELDYSAPRSLEEVLGEVLAERGVLLVTREQVRAAVYKAAENPAHDWHPREEQADDVWAALSGEGER